MKDKYLIIHKGIARWKLNNPFENWLSYKADNSELWKRIYVLYYRIFDYKYYKKGLKFIDKQLEIHKNKWEKNVSHDYVIRDMIYSLHRHGADFLDYWSFDFLTKSAVGKKQWVTDKLRYGYDDILSGPEVVNLVSDKYKSYLAFKQYYKRDALGCYNNSDINQFLSFVKKHPSFIYKPLNAFSGKGVKKITLHKDSFLTFFMNI